jgi:hypothetical protein
MAADSESSRSNGAARVSSKSAGGAVYGFNTAGERKRNWPGGLFLISRWIVDGARPSRRAIERID